MLESISRITLRFLFKVDNIRVQVSIYNNFKSKKVKEPRIGNIGVKIENNWVQKPYYTSDDNLPFGHGEKSVYMISGFLKLTREEAMAINWHMGGFDARVMGGASMMMAKAYYNYPVAVLCHMADFMATYLDEKIYE